MHGDKTLREPACLHELVSCRLKGSPLVGAQVDNVIDHLERRVLQLGLQSVTLKVQRNKRARREARAEEYGGNLRQGKWREVRYLLIRVELTVELFERVKHRAIADDSKKQRPPLRVVGEGCKADERVLEHRQALKGRNKAGTKGGRSQEGRGRKLAEGWANLWKMTPK